MVRTQSEPSTTSDIDIIDVSLSLLYQKLHGCGPHDAQNCLMKACFQVNLGALCAMKPFQDAVAGKDQIVEFFVATDVNGGSEERWRTRVGGIIIKTYVTTVHSTGPTLW